MPLIAADPVRNTVVGTIGVSLTDTAWAAAGTGCLAVRSSADYSVVLVGAWGDAERAELRDALAALPDLAAVSGAEAEVLPLLDLVGPDPRIERQRLFRLDALHEPDVAGRAVVAGPEHRSFGRACTAAFVREAHDTAYDTDSTADHALDTGQMYLWFDGSEPPVSLALRRPVLGGSARVGPVYTPPQHRGHGYASGVTAAATCSILAEGGIPVLFTDLANPTSNKIYQALGYYPVEDRVVASSQSA